jgi:hypothetical protein
MVLQEQGHWLQGLQLQGRQRDRVVRGEAEVVL